MSLDYKKLAAAKKDDILRDLGELIAIDSSEDLDNTSTEYPVGPGPVKAMKKFLSRLILGNRPRLFRFYQHNLNAG